MGLYVVRVCDYTRALGGVCTRMCLRNTVPRMLSMNIVHVGVSLLMLMSAQVAADDTTKDTSSVSPEKPQVAVFEGHNPVKTEITSREQENEQKNKRKNERKRVKRVHTVEKVRIPQKKVIEIGRQMAKQRGWTGRQWQALYQLWQKESGWNPNAVNPSSGAYGIPQALPGGKMRSVGSDWRNNPRTQIAWGMNYIAKRYGSPLKAWQHSQANNWY